MNILHITTYMQGGAGRVIRDLVFKQKENGHNVTVIMNGKNEVGYENYKEYINDLRENKIDFYFVDSTFKRDIYLNIDASTIVNNVLKQKNIDIIHSHATTPSMIAMIAKSNIDKKIPIIQTMHGWGTNKNDKHEKMDVSILNLVDKVVTVSNTDKELLISKGVIKSKIDVIYNGIGDIEDINNIDKNIELQLRELKNEGYTIIGCIGSICKRKNQLAILEALKNIKDANVRVIFIGEGESIEELKVKTIEYKISHMIKFYGYVSKGYLYINNFDYTILPSLSEGLPLSVLESFRAGKPVIVSDIDVFKEMIEDNKNGFIFNLNNKDSLASKINDAVKIKDTEQYILMSRKCYKEFQGKYRLDSCYNKYLNLYKRI